MASVRVRFCTGFPLQVGFPADQFAPAWWKETAGGEKRLLRRTAQQNEAPPAEFYCSLEKGGPGRTAPAVFRFRQRGEFPGEQTVRFLLRRYLKYAQHLRKRGFLLRRDRYSIHVEHHIRREFPGEQTVWFLLRRYSKYAQHLRKRGFLLRRDRYSIHVEHHIRSIQSRAPDQKTDAVLTAATLNRSIILNYKKLKIERFLLL
jgi:hypothetical protein